MAETDKIAEEIIRGVAEKLKEANAQFSEFSQNIKTSMEDILPPSARVAKSFDKLKTVLLSASPNFVTVANASSILSKVLYELSTKTSRVTSTIATSITNFFNNIPDLVKLLDSFSETVKTVASNLSAISSPVSSAADNIANFLSPIAQLDQALSKINVARDELGLNTMGNYFDRFAIAFTELKKAVITGDVESIQSNFNKLSEAQKQLKQVSQKYAKTNFSETIDKILSEINFQELNTQLTSSFNEIMSNIQPVIDEMDKTKIMLLQQAEAAKKLGDIDLVKFYKEQIQLIDMQYRALSDLKTAITKGDYDVLVKNLDAASTTLPKIIDQLKKSGTSFKDAATMLLAFSETEWPKAVEAEMQRMEVSSGKIAKPLIALANRSRAFKEMVQSFTKLSQTAGTFGIKLGPILTKVFASAWAVVIYGLLKLINRFSQNAQTGLRFLAKTGLESSHVFSQSSAVMRNLIAHTMFLNKSLNEITPAIEAALEGYILTSADVVDALERSGQGMEHFQARSIQMFNEVANSIVSLVPLGEALGLSIRDIGTYVAQFRTRLNIGLQRDQKEAALNFKSYFELLSNLRATTGIQMKDIMKLMLTASSQFRFLNKSLGKDIVVDISKTVKTIKEVWDPVKEGFELTRDHILEVMQDIAQAGQKITPEWMLALTGLEPGERIGDALSRALKEVGVTPLQRMTKYVEFMAKRVGPSLGKDIPSIAMGLGSFVPILKDLSPDPKVRQLIAATLMRLTESGKRQIKTEDILKSIVKEAGRQGSSAETLARAQRRLYYGTTDPLKTISIFIQKIFNLLSTFFSGFARIPGAGTFWSSRELAGTYTGKFKP